jgi:hypothetical protein
MLNNKASYIKLVYLYSTMQILITLKCIVPRISSVPEVNELWLLILNLYSLLCIDLSVNVQRGQLYVDNDSVFDVVTCNYLNM